MLESDLILLRDAAEEAGRIAQRYWKNAPDAWDKGGGAGPVSEADLAVNAMLETDLRAARPDYGWLSEESVAADDRLAADTVFIIDPIDGTRAFLQGEGSFAHSLAIARGGKVVAGVVHLPVLGLTYCATSDGDAKLNGALMQPGNRSEIAGADVLTSQQTDLASQWKGGPPGYRRSFRSSLAWRLCLVAEGRFDATLTLRPTWEWDVAAASLIAERVGLCATDRQGQALRFNRARPQSDGLIVANPVLHAAFLDKLAYWPG